MQREDNSFSHEIFLKGDSSNPDRLPFIKSSPFQGCLSYFARKEVLEKFTPMRLGVANLDGKYEVKPEPSLFTFPKRNDKTNKASILLEILADNWEVFLPLNFPRVYLQDRRNEDEFFIARYNFDKNGPELILYDKSENSRCNLSEKDINLVVPVGKFIAIASKNYGEKWQKLRERLSSGTSLPKLSKLEPNSFVHASDIMGERDYRKLIVVGNLDIHPFF